MAQYRKNPLVTNQYYHIFSRSIADFIIFNSSQEYERMLRLINLFRFQNFNYKFAEFNDLNLKTQKIIVEKLINTNNTLVEIAAFCFMPSHIHLILKQLVDMGIAKYISRVLNSYSRYFNVKHRRTGPLWASRFKSVLISNDTQLLHLTRYIHLNPTSAGLVNKPEDWKFSSYDEYINAISNNYGICKFHNIIDKKPKDYRKFVEDRKSYQRELSIIKNALIDDYSS